MPTESNNNLESKSSNRYIITWMLYQILMYSNKVILPAGLNNDPHPIPHPLHSYWIKEMTNK